MNNYLKLNLAVLCTIFTSKCTFELYQRCKIVSLLIFSFCWYVSLRKNATIIRIFLLDESFCLIAEAFRDKNE